MTPRTSNNDYERTPRPPPPAILPKTPISSCKVTVTSVYHIPKQPLSDRFTYRAHRVHIQPTIDFPPPPPLSELADNYEDMNNRPAHNLLSNIVPSSMVSSSSSEHIASSVGFDPTNESRQTIYSNTDPFAKNQSESDESSSDSSNDYQMNPIDYLCKSTSTINVNSPYTL